MQYHATMSIERINKIEELLNAFISVKFENYVALYDFVEMHIGTVQKEIDIEWNKLEELEYGSFDACDEENVLNQAFKFDNEFPNRIRYSGIIQTYSLLEYYMKWLCNKLEKIEDSKFSLHDLKGNSDIKKGKLFLSKLYQIDLKKLEPEWTFINDMRIIRNQIIHKNGEIEMTNNELTKIIEKYDDLGIMFEDVYKNAN